MTFTLRLRESLRRSDLVGRHTGSDTAARLGGDEFVVLIDEFVDPFELQAVAERVLAAAAQPFPLAGPEGEVSASIGISVYPIDGTDIESLTKSADSGQARLRARRGPVTAVRSIFWLIVKQCLEPDASRRFSSYAELRDSIKSAMKGAKLGVVDWIVNKDRKLVGELVNRGASLRSLGLLEDSLRCYDEALSLEPHNTGWARLTCALSEQRFLCVHSKPG